MTASMHCILLYSYKCAVSTQTVHTVSSPMQQVTLLKESLHGFVFESNRGTRVTMTANSPLGPQFNFGWNNKKGKKFKTKNDVTKDKVCKVATEVTLGSEIFSCCKEIFV